MSGKRKTPKREKSSLRILSDYSSMQKTAKSQRKRGFCDLGDANVDRAFLGSHTIQAGLEEFASERVVF